MVDLSPEAQISEDKFFGQVHKLSDIFNQKDITWDVKLTTSLRCNLDPNLSKLPAH